MWINSGEVSRRVRCDPNARHLDVNRTDWRARWRRCPGMKEPFRSKRFQGVVEVRLPMHGLNDRHNERGGGKVILPQGEWIRVGTLTDTIGGASAGFLQGLRPTGSRKSPKSHHPRLHGYPRVPRFVVGHWFRPLRIVGSSKSLSSSSGVA
jgi:hypothetical protein